MMVNSHIIHLCAFFLLGLILRAVYHNFYSRGRRITSSCYLNMQVSTSSIKRNIAGFDKKWMALIIKLEN